MRVHYTMFMSGAKIAEQMCTQHHQPRSQCEPWDRHGHTMRFREDLWAQAEDTAAADGSDVTSLLTQCLEAQLGHLRCYRCKPGNPPVPVTFGDLTGKPLREWLTGAAETVIRQHPRHEPILIGAEPASLALVAADLDTPRSPVFREPGQ